MNARYYQQTNGYNGNNNYWKTASFKSLDMITPIDFNATLLNTIRNAKNILLVGHKLPDPDCIGAVIATKDILEKLGKNITILLEDGVPRGFRFLESTKNIVTTLPEIEIDCVILLDCNNLERVGGVGSKIKELKESTILKIDHHSLDPHSLNDSLETNDYIGKDSSASEIVYCLVKSLGVDIAKLNYESLYVMYKGIMADTGSLKYGTTTLNAKAIVNKIKKIVGEERLREYNNKFYNSSWFLNEDVLYGKLADNGKVMTIDNEEFFVTSLNLIEQHAIEGLEPSDIAKIPSSLRRQEYNKSVIFAVEQSDALAQVFVYLKKYSKFSAVKMVRAVREEYPIRYPGETEGGHVGAAGITFSGIDMKNEAANINNQLETIFKDACLKSFVK